MKYKTKPCEINAMEWTGDNMQEIIQFANTPEKTSIYIVEGVPVIRTLEGDMRANVGDYIIRGLRGEYYPCKPDVFHKKYELLETEVECVKSKYGDNPIYSSDLTKHTYPLGLIGLTSAKGWREIADTYGDAQVFLLIEEMSELTQSLTKYMRYKGKGQPVRKPFYTVMDNITEEFSDVLVMLSQIQYLLDIPTDKVNDIADGKLLRTLKLKSDLS